jgi:hypothetical protein
VSPFDTTRAAHWAAGQATLDDPWAVAELLRELRAAGADDAVTALATRAAIVQAIEEGQTIANRDATAAQAAIAEYDKLPLQMTAAMVLSGYPIGPMDETHIQPVARGHPPVRHARQEIRH